MKHSAHIPCVWSWTWSFLLWNHCLHWAAWSTAGRKWSQGQQRAGGDTLPMKQCDSQHLGARWCHQTWTQHTTSLVMFAAQLTGPLSCLWPQSHLQSTICCWWWWCWWAAGRVAMPTSPWALCLGGSFRFRLVWSATKETTSGPSTYIPVRFFFCPCGDPSLVCPGRVIDAESDYWYSLKLHWRAAVTDLFIEQLYQRRLCSLLSASVCTSWVCLSLFQWQTRAATETGHLHLSSFVIICHRRETPAAVCPRHWKVSAHALCRSLWNCSWEEGLFGLLLFPGERRGRLGQERGKKEDECLQVPLPRSYSFWWLISRLEKHSKELLSGPSQQSWELFLGPAHTAGASLHSE